MFYLDVALPVPLRKSFLYAPLKNTNIEEYKVGARVKVKFGKGNRFLIGIITSVVRDLTDYPLYKDFDIKKVKSITSLIDQESIISDDIYHLINFSINYYHYYIGEIYSASMPSLLKAGNEQSSYHNKLIQLNTDSNFLLSHKKLSASQKKLLDLLLEHRNQLTMFGLHQFGIKDSTITSLVNKGWLFIKDINKCQEHNHDVLNQVPLVLNKQQQTIVDAVKHKLEQFSCNLIYGITGSGKTEVYLHLIQQVLYNNRQVLVLVPEISLTPQTVNRFKHRFNVRISVIHSKVYANVKTQDWLAAKDGHARIIIGTRSSIFTPCKNLGLIIIDEEHDLSFKQQEGFRYNCRDLAIIRAQRLNIPIVMGSATPSIESVANVLNDKYSFYKLTERAGDAKKPNVKLLNIQQKKLQAGLSEELIKQVKFRLESKQQVLIFLNRRGYAPVVKCNNCNWGAVCQRCNVHFTMHKSDASMVCHYCMSVKQLPKSCPDCGSIDLNSYGVGTEQIEEYVTSIFKKYPCIRIDRDTTKKKDDLPTYLKKINQNEPMILLGTQMLAKGHHFPNVTLVAVLDVDSSLFSTDFRAPERITQLLLQVAGRAGRSNKASEVIIQTTQPEHKVLQDILHKDYWDIAKELYEIRKIAKQPPCSNWALIRAESYDLNNTMSFLQDLSKLSVGIIEQQSQINTVKIMGPILAPRVKKAGMLRGQLLLAAKKRQELHFLMQKLLVQIESIDNKSVRWSLDVDPQDIY